MALTRKQKRILRQLKKARKKEPALSDKEMREFERRMESSFSELKQ